MPIISFALLVVFVLCGLVFARASKALNALDTLRLKTEPPEAPQHALHAATQFARRMGIPMAPGGEELKSFCERHGRGAEYARAHRLLFGSVLVALACAFVIIRLGPAVPKPATVGTSQAQPGQPPQPTKSQPNPAVPLAKP